MILFLVSEDACRIILSCCCTGTQKLFRKQYNRVGRVCLTQSKSYFEGIYASSGLYIVLYMPACFKFVGNDLSKKNYFNSLLLLFVTRIYTFQLAPKNYDDHDADMKKEASERCTATSPPHPRLSSIDLNLNHENISFCMHYGRNDG